MTDTTPEHIVVVGGGQAGGWVCKTLRREGYTGHLTVVADEPHDFYERPPLSKAALTDGAELPRLFPESEVNDLAIDWRRPNRAVRLNADTHELTLDNGDTLTYDKLVLATGARPRVPVPRWANMTGVLTLRNWQDAQRLKERLGSARQLAVVGGGWIGLEVAASARKLGLKVTVYELQPRLCGRSVGSEVSDALRRLHVDAGVTVRLDTGPIDLSENADEQLLVTTGSRTDGPFDLAIVGAGVEFNLDLARQAGLDIQQGVVVDDRGRTSDPDIFAAGDIAQHPHLGLCLQSWAYAQNQSMVVARALLGQDAHYDEPAWLWSDQHGANIQILGIAEDGSQCVVRDDKTGPVYFYLTPERRLSQLVAFNQPRAIKLGKRWLAAGRELDPDQLADPDFNLMSLK
ncbi:NAD(P)/FAD-dependent oxidoreductase [Saccharospirillum salsuginis]|uniref:Pyridine nucleotide-disulfide oxidoreductase n=1 Tax=Saccharospirillum salsuginis TaxID=418750 RepID=A0A918N6V8_9GAMM|nr:FAD-dependent oxidoreductase [Saccharospirillum salsuginis]GGX45165.1 pyridine nucleotide-disulfide oxidoreductase [Saccharospirillum salsuginis]